MKQVTDSMHKHKAYGDQNSRAHKFLMMPYYGAT